MTLNSYILSYLLYYSIHSTHAAYQLGTSTPTVKNSSVRNTNADSDKFTLKFKHIVFTSFPFYWMQAGT